MKIRFLICGLMLALAGSVHAQDSPDSTLDALHKAGADANQPAFTALLAEDVIFLGMDGANRLEGAAARNFVRDSFASGKAWTYNSSLREIRLSGDGSVAWFDEALEHDRRGNGRGTGVLIREGGGWKVAQYSLTMPLPDALAGTSAAVGAQAGAAASAPPTDVQATQKQEKPRCQMISHKTNTRADC
jgi:hypothetical protein